VTAAVWRYSSGAAVAAFAALPVVAVLMDRSWMFQIFSLLVTGMIVLRHMDNVLRLWQGTEPKIGS